uniref:Pecanex-like protein n=4 Tax=Hirondellea gigas TaxID=1518452 RepID=A0A6A7FS33_9CRUS
MGSQSMEILRQGVWASLTGGWFYDPRKPIFCNSFHLYLWLYLVCAPFSIYLSGVGWWVGWMIHLILLVVISSIIKGSNYLLHHTFDTSQCQVQLAGPSSNSPHTPLPPLPPRHAHSLTQHRSNRREQRLSRMRSLEVMELPVMTNRSTENSTPPVDCSSRNSTVDNIYATPINAINTSNLGLTTVLHNPGRGAGSISSGNSAPRTPEPVVQDPGGGVGSKLDGGPPHSSSCTSPFPTTPAPAAFPTHAYDLAALKEYLREVQADSRDMDLRVQVHGKNAATASLNIPIITCSRTSTTLNTSSSTSSQIIINSANKNIAGGGGSSSKDRSKSNTPSKTTHKQQKNNSSNSAVRDNDDDASDTDISDDVMDSEEEVEVVGKDDYAAAKDKKSSRGSRVDDNGNPTESWRSHRPFPGPEPPPQLDEGELIPEWFTTMEQQLQQLQQQQQQLSNRPPLSRLYSFLNQQLSSNASSGGASSSNSNVAAARPMTSRSGNNNNNNKAPQKPPRQTGAAAAAAVAATAGDVSASRSSRDGGHSSAFQKSGSGVHHRVGTQVKDHPLAESPPPPCPPPAQQSREHRKKKRKSEKRRGVVSGVNSSVAAGDNNGQLIPESRNSRTFLSDDCGRISRLASRPDMGPISPESVKDDSSASVPQPPSPQKKSNYSSADFGRIATAPGMSVSSASVATAASSSSRHLTSSKGSGYQALVWRNPSSSNSSSLPGGSADAVRDNVCTLTFENIYAADEGSSSDMKVSSSSEENIMAMQQQQQQHKQQQALLGREKSSKYEAGQEEDDDDEDDDIDELTTIPALKPLSYPDDSLVTATDDSSLLRANWGGGGGNNNSSGIAADEELLSDTSQLHSSESDSEEVEASENSHASTDNILERQQSVDSSGELLANSLLKEPSERNGSRQTVIINVDVNDKGNDRTISAVNYSICIPSVAFNSDDTVMICEDCLNKSESDAQFLCSAYENLADEAFGDGEPELKREGVQACSRKAACCARKAAAENIRGDECNISEEELSSNPDIEWLFCHSDSDSEFADLAKLAPPPPPPLSAVVNKYLPSACSEENKTEGIGNDHEPDDDGDLWSRSRSPLEKKHRNADGEALGFVRRHPTSRQISSISNDGSLTGADDGIGSGNKQQLQGAIPKKKRHGVIMDDSAIVASTEGSRNNSTKSPIAVDGSSSLTTTNTGEDQESLTSSSEANTEETANKGTTNSISNNIEHNLGSMSNNNLDVTAAKAENNTTAEVVGGVATSTTSAAGEVSSVTMDLMRRMLDVFSSYPEHCHIDIKKLLVLVSLEQQNNNNRATVTALGGVVGGSINKTTTTGGGDGGATSTTGASGTIPATGSYTLPPQSSPPQSSPIHPKHSTLPNASSPPSSSTVSSPATHSGDVIHKLHRKHAVRRRRYGSFTTPPVSPKGNTNCVGGIIASVTTPATTTFPGVCGADINYQPAVLTHEQRRSLSPEDKWNSTFSSSALDSRNTGTRVLPNPHLAASYEDTSAGAVHCYQDDHGKWFTYTFKESILGHNMANPDDLSRSAQASLPTLTSAISPFSSSFFADSTSPNSNAFRPSIQELLIKLSAGDTYKNGNNRISCNNNTNCTTTTIATTTTVTSSNANNSVATASCGSSNIAPGTSTSSKTFVLENCSAPGNMNNTLNTSTTTTVVSSDGGGGGVGGVSLSSSSMSLCSGLTVILDQQLSSASAPPSHPPWNAGGMEGRRRSSGGVVLRRPRTVDIRASYDEECRADDGGTSNNNNNGASGTRGEGGRQNPHSPSWLEFDSILNRPARFTELELGTARHNRPQGMTLIRNLTELSNMQHHRRHRGLNFLTSAFQEMRRSTSTTNNNNNNNTSNTSNNSVAGGVAGGGGGDDDDDSNSNAAVSFTRGRPSSPSTEAFHRALRSFINNDEDEMDDIPSPFARLQFAAKSPTRHYYELKFLKKKFKILFDRLALLSLLDRNLSIIENVVTVFLILTVGLLGCWILQLGLYKELQVLIFCVVMASSQYSMFKSVQPDAASPIHGYNHIILYSRPLYFISCCSSVLLLHWATLPSQQPLPSFHLYGVNLTSWTLLNTLKEFFLYFLLSFPLLFSLGLLPQVNTFLMYALEQIDIHVFGGNATTSLSSAFYCVLRSCLAVACLCGFAYGGLIDSGGTVAQANTATVEHSSEKVASRTFPGTDGGQYILYSIFCALLLAFSYHLSRSCADYTTLWQLVQRHVFPEELGSAAGLQETTRNRATTAVVKEGDVADENSTTSAVSTTPADGNGVDQALEGGIKLPDEDEGDPLPEKLRSTVLSRLTHDMLICSLLACIVMLLHSTSALHHVLQHIHPLALWLPPVVLGFLIHYIIPQLRKQQPWLCIARPICMQHEYGNYEVYDAAKVMCFEKLYVWLCMLERNVVYPVLFTCALTADAAAIVTKHEIIGPLLIVICGLKCMRSAYSYPPSQFLILAFTKLFFNYDIRGFSETFLIDYFFMSIIYKKMYEFLLKLKFIVTYIAPWQITWGSAFHAFAQPFSVPHSAMLFVQAAVSAVLSTPLNPVLGSAIFITSYVRPVKFWERDYNTKRMDQSNTRLSTSLLDHNPGADDNNLNSIFYEHLTRSLQHSLCGDLMLGRWGPAGEGDCFVLASDNLNCLVHLTEVANGIVTFQVRGLEFRGTYCQQREVEAISEGFEEDHGCCCCEPGRLPHLLSGNAAFNQRWLAWEVTATKYVLEGYSISDNSAASMFQMFDLRKILISYYVKSIIFHVSRHPRLVRWLTDPDILSGLRPLTFSYWAELDPTFHHKTDEDYDHKEIGITRHSFLNTYHGWIKYCMRCREAIDEQGIKSDRTDNGGGGAAGQRGRLREEMERRLSFMGSGVGTSSTSRPIGGLGRLRANNTATDRVSNASSDRALLSAHLEERAKKISLNAADRSDRKRESERDARNASNCRLNADNHRSSTGVTATAVSGGGSDGQEQQEPPGDTPVRKINSNGTVEYDTSESSALVSLCLGLSLLGRRALGSSSHNENVEFFLHGLHSLFKGDFRITCERDEWVFTDMELLKRVVSPAIRMSLKLHLDHFLVPDEYDVHESLYGAMLEQQQQRLVIAHEADPGWRAAVLASRPALLALRHVLDDGDDKYKIIMLNKRHLLFRVIKVNRECVRGLWAGQQQELVYLRNRNPERGSIQNAKQALRNMINSSCDQPIGYPIYVSPLTTSYSHTHPELARIGGQPITPALIGGLVSRLWTRLRARCGEGCSSGGSSGLNGDCGGGGAAASNLTHIVSSVPPVGRSGQEAGVGGVTSGGLSAQQLAGAGGGSLSRGSMLSTSSSLGGVLLPPNKQQSSTALASLAGLLGAENTATLSGGSLAVPPANANSNNSSISRSASGNVLNNLPRSSRYLQQSAGSSTARDCIATAALQRDVHSARDDLAAAALSLSSSNEQREGCIGSSNRASSVSNSRYGPTSVFAAGLERSCPPNSGDTSASLPGLLSASSLAPYRGREWDNRGRVGRGDSWWQTNFGGSCRDSSKPDSERHLYTEMFDYDDRDVNIKVEYNCDIRDGTKDCVREYRELGRQRERREVRAQRRERAREATKDLYYKQSDRRKRHESNDSKDGDRSSRKRHSKSASVSKIPMDDYPGRTQRFHGATEDDFVLRDYFSDKNKDNVIISGSEVMYKKNEELNDTHSTLYDSQENNADSTLEDDVSRGALLSRGIPTIPPSLTTRGPFLTPHSPELHPFSEGPILHPRSSPRLNHHPTFSTSRAASLPTYTCNGPANSQPGLPSHPLHSANVCPHSGTLRGSIPATLSSNPICAISESSVSSGNNDSDYSVPVPANRLDSDYNDSEALGSNNPIIPGGNNSDAHKLVDTTNNNTTVPESADDVDKSWSLDHVPAAVRGLSLPDGGMSNSGAPRTYGSRSRHSSDDVGSTAAVVDRTAPVPLRQQDRVVITDANQIYDTLNLGRRVDVRWPDEVMRVSGGRNFWGLWVPEEGMEGKVVHRWTPHHPDMSCRSHVDRNIILVQIGEYFVPVAEHGLARIQ